MACCLVGSQRGTGCTCGGPDRTPYCWAVWAGTSASRVMSVSDRWGHRESLNDDGKQDGTR